MAYLDFPYKHHVRLRANNVQELTNEEIKRGTRVVGVFPSAESMMRPVGSVLVDVNEEWMGARFIDTASLRGVARSETARSIPENVLVKARFCVEAAVAEKKGRPHDPGVEYNQFQATSHLPGRPKTRASQTGP